MAIFASISVEAPEKYESLQQAYATSRIFDHEVIVDIYYLTGDFLC